MQTVSASPSVVLVTIDCWRLDAVRNMSALNAFARSWLWGAALCQGASTNSAFPPLLASEYALAAYDENGLVKPSVLTLPRVLHEHGYETAAFIGHNPWLEKWRDQFGEFWNDRIRGGGNPAGPKGRLAVRWAGRLLRLAALRTRVHASEVLARGLDWYDAREGPKFLWMHLMDAHEPYCPGLRRGMRLGLLKSYRALMAHALRDGRGNGLSAPHRRQLRELYGQCVESLDAALGEFLTRIPEHAIVLIIGDHGEEFDHGAFRHARVYEECVRVPFCLRWGAGGGAPAAFRSEHLRQLDVAPALAEGLGVPRPDCWKGDPKGKRMVSLAMNGSGKLARFYLSLRTPEWKYIRVHRLEDMEVRGAELYLLREDPDESRDLADDPRFAADRGRLERMLEDELRADGIDLSSTVEDKPGVAGVERHLRELGYL